MPGWLGWPRASPEGSRLKSYRLGLNSVGLSVGVGRWGGGAVVSKRGDKVLFLGIPTLLGNADRL